MIIIYNFNKFSLSKKNFQLYQYQFKGFFLILKKTIFFIY